ncbi:diacylglycerol kinase family lipid kinase [bacterium]|jgi:YegS/Rv2252/BmrU family lipid kinase|nr:diacylglycerol kinase family lipid kinase [Verrucomicrobiota bacterium]MDA7510302.1 diacylglycerol kinase family lipid kinase [Verrucomicrobiota bacterium]MDA7633511.1 diacylglycerol kinase family lipid kinase [bacterium]MDA7866901.1 diacylglycerol kinase family lipid kinase [Verrucomicrobiota bacterium]
MPETHYKVLVNPHGGTGTGSKILERIKPIFAATNKRLQVYVTERAGHAAELASQLDLSGCEGLCLIGGDGTIHEVINGLMSRGSPNAVPLGLIPGGTGNTVLQHFGCSDPIEAAKRIVKGRTQLFDIARVTTNSEVSYCANVIGWGAFADINEIAESWRRLGPSRYSIAAIAYMASPKKRRAILTLDDEVIKGDFYLIALCNTQYTGKGMFLAPSADSADGKLDVVIVREATRLQMLRLFRRVFNGTHLSLPFVETRRVQFAKIQHQDRDCLTLDGELKGSTPASVTVIPSALRIFASPLGASQNQIKGLT